jgi:TPR repeat protein
MKRYLPLLFVVLVVIATVAAFLVLREGESPAPAPGADPGPAVAADGIRELRVESEEEYQLALETLGTSSDEIEAWARSRGFPPATYTTSPGMPLERNYRRERDGRLLELAEEGDTWAMQFLAARISPELPLEAVEWYRKAVVHGSAYAAFKLGSFYEDVARWIVINNDDRDEVIEIARREDPLAYSALAWLLVADYEAGLPPGAMSASLAGFQAPDDAIVQSCIRAAGFLAEIHAERETLGLQVERRLPPLAIELPPEETVGYCDPDVFPRTDFSGCEAVRLVGDAGSVLGHRCR